MDQVILTQVTRQQLVVELTDNVVFAIRDELSQSTKQEKREFLTRKEVAALFKVSLVTVSDWSKNGIIQSYKIGSRVRFRKDEILEAVKAIETKRR